MTTRSGQPFRKLTPATRRKRHGKSHRKHRHSNSHSRSRSRSHG